MRTARLFIGLMALVLVASMARGQGFGRNKVNYARDNWEVIKSDHFEIFYPKGALWLAEFTATTAEDALAQLEETWRYELENTIPMIIYTSHNSFSETNVIGGLISEGTGGFTEFNRNRIVIPFEGSYEQMRHVVHHELVHALQYDMFMSGSLKSLALNRLVSLPLWAVEGLAEFESMGWDAEADNVMRDATISDYVPPIEYMLGGVFAYKGGQSLYRYLAEAYGRDKVADFLRAMKQSANAERSLENVFGDSMEEIDKGWKTWLKREYWPEIAERKSPYEYADPLTDHMENGGYLNVGAEISPDGKQVAYVSTDRGFADVYLMNVETKKVERVITGQQSPDFESLFLLRPGIAWSPDGQYLAIVAKQHGKNALFIFDVQEREVERSYVYDLDAMFTPTWHPVGNRLIVVGLKDGWSDLYNIDVPAGTLTRLTNDPYDERDPDWSPDGKRIVFSTDRPNLDLYYEDTRPFEFGQYNLMTLELEPMTLEQLTYHPANDEFPVWGPDGRSILFVSERSGIGNLYLLDLTDNSARPVTDSLTSLQQIDWSANGEKVVFSAFSEGGYDIYLMGDPRAIAPGEVAPTLTEYARRAYAEGFAQRGAAGGGRDRRAGERRGRRHTSSDVRAAETDLRAVHLQAEVRRVDPGRRGIRRAARGRNTSAGGDGIGRDDGGRGRIDRNRLRVGNCVGGGERRRSPQVFASAQLQAEVGHRVVRGEHAGQQFQRVQRTGVPQHERPARQPTARHRDGPVDFIGEEPERGRLVRVLAESV